MCSLFYNILLYIAINSDILVLKGASCIKVGTLINATA